MDDLTRAELDDLLDVFRDQSLQILEEMSQDILLAESNKIDAEAMARLRRAAHTIKGDSACIGLDRIAQLAHRIEDIFDAVVTERKSLEKNDIDIMLESLDAFRVGISAEQVVDIAQEEFNRLSNRLNSSDALIAESVFGFSGVTADSKGEDVDDGTEVEQKQSDIEAKLEQSLSEQSSGRPRREFMRVEAGRMDALLNIAGEMVLARSLMNQLGSDLDQAFPKNGLVNQLGQANAQMSRLVEQFQKSILTMRMLTVDQVFRRFARPMRQLASERGKLVEFEVLGGRTELDRGLIDLLHEPLLHILRNAVDHGIETKKEREASGKPGAGRILIRAYQEGNQVVVEVSDDGRGIDMELLKRKAVERGEISDFEAGNISDEAAVDLIFLPGFSTLSQITQVSGRGIGASAVRTAVEKMGGSVSVKTKMGEGTTFTIRVPLTLAIIKGLLFTSCGQLFALPLLAASEIVQVEASEIIRLGGFESYRLRDSFISVLRPGEVLGFERRRRDKGLALRRQQNIFIIIIIVRGKRYGIAVDSLEGEQELVIKPLDSRWIESDALAGAAVLGDGRVVLIMDSERIYHKGLAYEQGIGVKEEVYGS